MGALRGWDFVCQHPWETQDGKPLQVVPLNFHPLSVTRLLDAVPETSHTKWHPQHIDTIEWWVFSWWENPEFRAGYHFGPSISGNCFVCKRCSMDSEGPFSIASQWLLYRNITSIKNRKLIIHIAMEHHHFQWWCSTISMTIFHSYFDITSG